MGVDSSIFADECNDPNDVEKLPSLLELRGAQVRESGRVKKQLNHLEERHVVSDIVFVKKPFRCRN